jgi:hypothetical protein
MNKQMANQTASILIPLDEYLQLLNGQSTDETTGKSNKKVVGRKLPMKANMKKVSHYYTVDQ